MKSPKFVDIEYQYLTYRRQKGGFLILWPSRRTSLSGVLCVGGKNVNFCAKKSIRSLLQADLGTIMREGTCPSFGINQMLVSASGGEGSS